MKLFQDPLVHVWDNKNPQIAQWNIEGHVEKKSVNKHNPPRILLCTASIGRLKVW